MHRSDMLFIGISPSLIVDRPSGKYRIEPQDVLPFVCP